MSNVIESSSNDRIKSAVKLAASARERKQRGEFFLEGLRLCRDAAECGVTINAFFYTDEALEKHKDDVDIISTAAKSSFLVSSTVAQKMSNTTTPQGFFCVCSFLPEKDENLVFSGGKFIALENIQDPANLGAISRTAEALGITALIVEGGCDIYNPKAQRAAMGSLLRLPVIRTDDLFALLEKCDNSFKLYATTPRNDATLITRCDMSGSVIALIGNEANGVNEKFFGVCQKVTIPMNGRAESLNASVAAAITMWELMRR